ncbi:MAG: crossover junction endodeoxyribonuclease RuvC [Verrucomicrobiota bacterium]
MVGYGRASKEQVIKSVQSQLNLSEPLPSDEADACGAALCHGYTYREA